MRSIKENVHAIYGFIALFIAALGVSGIIVKFDTVGQIIWGVIWALIAWFWFTKKIPSSANKDKHSE